MGEEFRATLVSDSTPLIGYELQENLRFRVNPVTRQIKKCQKMKYTLYSAITRPYEL